MTQTYLTPEPLIPPPFPQLDAGLVCSQSPSTIKPGLARVKQWLSALNNPQLAVPVVHVAGTNGKGSVCTLLTQILVAAGYRVGTTISPHLVSISERILLNGTPISVLDWDHAQSQLTQVIARHPHWEKPTYFEAVILLAFLAFQRWQVDVAIVETGMGGRLDATNVVDSPLITAITTIGLDHTEFLGDTVAAVAAEKAGIIKPKVPVVVGPSVVPSALNVIQTVAQQQQSPLVVANRACLTVESISEEGQNIADAQRELRYTLPLLGAHQVANLSVVLALAERLNALGWAIPEAALQQGIGQSRWPARCEVMPDRCLVIDGSHNPDGWHALGETLNAVVPAVQWQLVLAVKASKEVAGLAALLSALNPERVVCTQGQAEWGEYYTAESLASHIAPFTQATVVAEPNWQQAIQVASPQPQQSQGNTKPWRLVTGSLHLAGAVRALENSDFNPLD